MKSVTMDDLRSYRFVKFADGYSFVGLAQHRTRLPRARLHAPRTPGGTRRTYMNTALFAGCGRRHDPAGIHAPQLRYLSDFSRVTVLP